MPRVKISKKEVPDWTYPPELRAIMREFEQLVEKIRKETEKCGRNLKAGVRARKFLQEMRLEMTLKLRTALFAERDRVEALRHGVSVAEWRRQRGGRRER